MPETPPSAGAGKGRGRGGDVVLVLEFALDDLGLGATAGAHNPLDVLVIGGQDILNGELRLSVEHAQVLCRQSK